MFVAIDKYKKAIGDLCARHGVARLELFGPATEDSFDPAQRFGLLG